MKWNCIADEDTVRGLRLAGVPGVVATSAKEASAAVLAAMTQPDCGIIILTHELADAIRPLVDQLRLERERPLILEIPGPQGVPSGHQSLRQLVQSAVGIRLNLEKGA